MNREAVLVIAELMWALRRSGAHTFFPNMPLHKARKLVLVGATVGLAHLRGRPVTLASRRRAPAAQLCSGVSCVVPALQPSHRRTGAQAEAFGRFPPRCAGHDGFDNAFPQVIRIGLRHRFGPPESRINAARLAHSHTIGTPD